MVISSEPPALVRRHQEEEAVCTMLPKSATEWPALFVLFHCWRILIVTDIFTTSPSRYKYKSKPFRLYASHSEKSLYLTSSRLRITVLINRAPLLSALLFLSFNFSPYAAVDAVTLLPL